MNAAGIYYDSQLNNWFSSILVVISIFDQSVIRMLSAPMAPATDSASPGSASRLPTSAASSSPSEQVHDRGADASAGSLGVSKTMVEEEKKMEEIALREERERNERLRMEREEDLKGGEEAMDSKFKRLQYLLGQSEVRDFICYSAFTPQLSRKNRSTRPF